MFNCGCEWKREYMIHHRILSCILSAAYLAVESARVWLFLLVVFIGVNYLHFCTSILLALFVGMWIRIRIGYVLCSQHSLFSTVFISHCICYFCGLILIAVVMRFCICVGICMQFLFCLSASPFVCLSMCPSVCPSVCLSVQLSAQLHDS